MTRVAAIGLEVKSQIERWSQVAKAAGIKDE